jgi:hypothetical protein
MIPIQSIIHSLRQLLFSVYHFFLDHNTQTSHDRNITLPSLSFTVLPQPLYYPVLTPYIIYASTHSSQLPSHFLQKPMVLPLQYCTISPTSSKIIYLIIPSQSSLFFKPSYGILDPPTLLIILLFQLYPIWSQPTPCCCWQYYSLQYVTMQFRIEYHAIPLCSAERSLSHSLLHTSLHTPFLLHLFSYGSNRDLLPFVAPDKSLFTSHTILSPSRLNISPASPQQDLASPGRTLHCLQQQATFGCTLHFNSCTFGTSPNNISDLNTPLIPLTTTLHIIMGPKKLDIYIQSVRNAETRWGFPFYLGFSETMVGLPVKGDGDCFFRALLKFFPSRAHISSGDLRTRLESWIRRQDSRTWKACALKGAQIEQWPVKCSDLPEDELVLPKHGSRVSFAMIDAASMAFNMEIYVYYQRGFWLFKPTSSPPDASIAILWMHTFGEEVSVRTPFSLRPADHYTPLLLPNDELDNDSLRDLLRPYVIQLTYNLSHWTDIPPCISLLQLTNPDITSNSDFSEFLGKLKVDTVKVILPFYDPFHYVETHRCRTRSYDLLLAICQQQDSLTVNELLFQFSLIRTHSYGLMAALGRLDPEFHSLLTGDYFDHKLYGLKGFWLALSLLVHGVIFVFIPETGAFWNTEQLLNDIHVSCDPQLERPPLFVSVQAESIYLLAAFSEYTRGSLTKPGSSDLWHHLQFNSFSEEFNTVEPLLCSKIKPLPNPAPLRLAIPEEDKRIPINWDIAPMKAKSKAKKSPRLQAIPKRVSKNPPRRKAIGYTSEEEDTSNTIPESPLQKAKEKHPSKPKQPIIRNIIVDSTEEEDIVPFRTELEPNPPKRRHITPIADQEPGLDFESDLELASVAPTPTSISWPDSSRVPNLWLELLANFPSRKEFVALAMKSPTRITSAEILDLLYLSSADALFLQASMGDTQSFPGLIVHEIREHSLAIILAPHVAGVKVALKPLHLVQSIAVDLISDKTSVRLILSVETREAQLPPLNAPTMPYVWLGDFNRAPQHSSGKVDSTTSWTCRSNIPLESKEISFPFPAWIIRGVSIRDFRKIENHHSFIELQAPVPPMAHYFSEITRLSSELQDQGPLADMTPTYEAMMTIWNESSHLLYSPSAPYTTMFSQLSHFNLPVPSLHIPGFIASQI